MTCNLNGCLKPVAYDDNNDRVHDFCCKDHARRAIAAGQWSKPVRDQYHSTNSRSNGYCAYAGCNLQVFVDPTTHRVHDYCGRTHAKLDANRSNHMGKQNVSSAANSGYTGYAALNSSSSSSASNNKQPSAVSGATSSTFTGYAVVNNSSSSSSSSNLGSNIFGVAQNMTSTSTGYTTNSSSSMKPLSNVNVDDCAICLASMKDNKNVIVTICAHRFHNNCLTNWVTAANTSATTPTCPVCREEI